jgi:ABC-type dipeptide/oligopeptide/nickel transport system permease component
MSDPFLLNPTPWEHVRDLLTHMVLPSLTLALSLYGGYALVVQSSVLETLGQDHILLARAKGLPAAMILRRHALRNALLPTTTWIALALGHLVAGAILVETVFSWPGIGRAIYRAILDRDYPMLQGAFLVITLAVVVSNLLIDLLYTRLDPRAATA